MGKSLQGWDVQAKALDDVAAMVAGASFRRDEEPTFEVTELLRKVGDGIYSPFQPSVYTSTVGTG